MALVALPWVVVASIACATRPLMGTTPASAALPTTPPAWAPVERSMVGADQWVLAGEAASTALPRSHPKILFVGDSITQWWTRFGLATWNADFAPLGAVDDGVVGDTTSNLLYRLESGSLDGIHPEVVVTLIGTNNLHLGQTASQIARGIEEVVAVLHLKLPGARIVLLGLLPRDLPDSPARYTVNRIDQLLAASPVVRSGEATYINPGAALVRPNGQLLPGVLHADLLHPTALGYRILGRAIAPVVRSLLSS